MKDTRLNQHTVAHDAGMLVFAAFCGAVGSVVDRSLGIGVLMFGAVAMLGIGAMRITLARTAVNRLVLAASKAVR